MNLGLSLSNMSAEFPQGNNEKLARFHRNKMIKLLKNHFKWYLFIE